jgi:hypothetical protein
VCPISPVEKSGGAGGEDREEDEEARMDVEVGEEGQGAGRVEAKVRKGPGQPTREEIVKHNVTHLPYRSWCAHCVRGRGIAFPHLSQPCKTGEELPTVGADYHYMGVEGEEGTIPMLVIKDGNSKVSFDMVFTNKGPHEYMIKRVCQCLDLLVTKG